MLSKSVIKFVLCCTFKFFCKKSFKTVKCFWSEYFFRRISATTKISYNLSIDFAFIKFQTRYREKCTTLKVSSYTNNASLFIDILSNKWDLYLSRDHFAISCNHSWYFNPTRTFKKDAILRSKSRSGAQLRRCWELIYHFYHSFCISHRIRIKRIHFKWSCKMNHYIQR